MDESKAEPRPEVSHLLESDVCIDSTDIGMSDHFLVLLEEF